MASNTTDCHIQFNRAYQNRWRPLMESWKRYPEAYVLFRDLLKQAGIDYE